MCAYKSRLAYCKFGNFRENFIFGNSIKRHICDVRNSRLGHDIRISVNDSDFAILRVFYFDKTFAKLKPSQKISNLQYPI